MSVGQNASIKGGNVGSSPVSDLMEEVLHSSIGRLQYSDEGSKLIVEVDKGIAQYYRALIPKWMPVLKPLYDPHITVVRQEKEEPVHKEHWKKYQGEEVEFFYSPVVQQGKVYYWLNCFCSRIEDIRLELGLPVMSEYTLPPEGFRKCFHMTIGNQKFFPL